MPSRFVSTTPEKLAVLCAEEAASEAERAANDPARWLLAIAETHRALTCALVAALRGSAGIGAYTERGRKLWIAWFEDSRIRPDLPRPDYHRVDTPATLLSRAQHANCAADMGGKPLLLTPDQNSDLERLNGLRDDIEHVKPVHWHIGLAGLPRILGAAADALDQLFNMEPVYRHLTDEERSEAAAAVARLRALNG